MLKLKDHNQEVRLSQVRFCFCQWWKRPVQRFSSPDVLQSCSDLLTSDPSRINWEPEDWRIPADLLSSDVSLWRWTVFTSCPARVSVGWFCWIHSEKARRSHSKARWWQCGGLGCFAASGSRSVINEIMNTEGENRAICRWPQAETNQNNDPKHQQVHLWTAEGKLHEDAAVA